MTLDLIVSLMFLAMVLAMAGASKNWKNREK